jgi:hypothetical protein
MNVRNTLILFVILLGLAGYIYFYEIKGEKEKEAIKEKEGKLFDFKKEDIFQIELKNKEGNFLFKKEGNVWMVIHPVESKADKDNIEQIINDLESAKNERTIADSTSDLSSYGLNPANVELKFILKDGRSEFLLIGDKNPTESYIFAKKANNPQVFLTATGIFTNTDKKLFDLRDKSILDFETDAVKRISINRKEEPVVLKKSSDDWNIEKPVSANAMSSVVNSFLREIKDGKVKEFVSETSENLKKYSLDKAFIRIDLFVGENEAKKSLYIGGQISGQKNDQYYAKDDTREQIFTVDTTFVKNINKSLYEFRVKDITKFNRDSVDMVTLRYPDIKIICVKDSADSWRMIEPEKKKAKSSKISSLLWDVQNALAKEFIDSPAGASVYGFDKPQAEVILHQKDKEVARLILGKSIEKKKEKLIYAKTNITALVEEKLLENVKIKIEDLKEE